MATDWNYTREKKETNIGIEGDARCVITAAEESVSKAGNPMITITTKQSESGIICKYYMVKNEYFNKNATDLFDSFPSIGEGNFNLMTWVGCMGAAHYINDDNGYLKIKYFINAKKQEALPEWIGDAPERQEFTELDADEEEDLEESEEDFMPF